MCAIVCAMQILRDNRPSWKVSDPYLFRFKSDKIAATLKKSYDAHDDWHAAFIGASEVLVWPAPNCNVDLPPDSYRMQSDRLSRL